MRGDPLFTLSALLELARAASTGTVDIVFYGDGKQDLRQLAETLRGAGFDAECVSKTRPDVDGLHYQTRDEITVSAGNVAVQWVGPTRRATVFDRARLLGLRTADAE